MTAEPFRIDFVAVGPQCTGTSWLDQMLRGHPDICLPRQVKETMFLEQHFENGVPWYASPLPRRAGGQRRGGVRASCSGAAAPAGRGAALNPECRSVVTRRGRVGGTVSLWHHDVAKGRAPGDFGAAVGAMPGMVES